MSTVYNTPRTHALIPHRKAINRLPVETWSDILLFAASHPQTISYHNTSQPMGFSQVCKHWREIAHGTPRAWTWITLDLSAKSTQALLSKKKKRLVALQRAVTTYLERSGKLRDLDVRIVLPVGDTKNEKHLMHIALYPELWQSSSRWGSLRIENGISKAFALWAAMYHPKCRFVQPLNIRSIDFVVDSEEQDRLETAYRFQRYSRPPVIIDPWSGPPTTIDTTWDGCQQAHHNFTDFIMGSSIYLKKVNIVTPSRHFRQNPPQRWYKVTELTLTGLEDRLIQDFLPHLRMVEVLTLSLNPKTCDFTIDPLDLPHLRSLHIHTLALVVPLLSALTCPALESLTICTLRGSDGATIQEFCSRQDSLQYVYFPCGQRSGTTRLLSRLLDIVPEVYLGTFTYEETYNRIRVDSMSDFTPPIRYELRADYSPVPDERSRVRRTVRK